ncbi:MAG TPA: tetratricopeptide repeat protein [Thermoanaerobaculia bacterium]|nr:tetratricopeptide repeat protein [Thermoanaerobaculia bacterium]
MKRNPEALGMALSAILSRRGLSPSGLVRKTGISRNQVEDYLKGRKVPRPASLAKIAKALDASIEEIKDLANLLGAASGGPAAARSLRAATLLAGSGEMLLPGRSIPGPSHFVDPAAERRAAPGLWERLRPWFAAQRRVIVLREEAYHSFALCELLCHNSEDAASDKADRALELADLAVLLARLVGLPLRPRLLGYAFHHLGNAIRVKGRLPEAEKAFDQGEALWEAGADGDPQGLLDGTRLLDLKASLLRDQRQLPESLDLLDQALSANPGGERAGRILVKRAKTLEELGRYEEAVANLQEAGPKIDGEREPRVLLTQRFNLAENLWQLGRYAEAAPLLIEVKELNQRLRKGLDRIRYRWLEGRIAAGLGHIEEAIAALEEVRSSFAAEGIPYDTALASLELSMLYLKQNRTAEVKELARQMVAIFRANKVHREALAAVLVFRDAAEREDVTADLAQRLTDYLRRAGSEPGLRFGA